MEEDEKTELEKIVREESEKRIKLLEDILQQIKLLRRDMNYNKNK